jgi:hypothetical protein
MATRNLLSGNDLRVANLQMCSVYFGWSAACVSSKKDFKLDRQGGAMPAPA